MRKAVFFNSRVISNSSSNANPALIVNVESGSNVSIKNNFRTFEKVSENGVASFSLPSLGQWEVSCVKGNKIWKDSVIVREYQVYDVSVEYHIVNLLVCAEKNTKITAQSRGG